MENYTYIIIGGGMTAQAALKGLRAVDLDGKAGLFTAEAHLPYSRPPLTKGLWTGKESLDQIWLDIPQENTDFHTNCSIVRLDPQEHIVEDQEGQLYHYEKLLLATGGSPRSLPFSVPGLIYFRTLDDYLALQTAARPGKTFAVIGGGFIGAEIAAALCMTGSLVKIIFPEDGLNRRIFPSGLSQYLNDYYRQKGVEVLPGEMISDIRKNGGQYHLRLESGKQIHADGVVAGIGLAPNTQLADAAGLKVDDGIHVDPFLQTTHPDIFAAGDVANFYAPAAGARMRVEHEDNALSMGAVAGSNMAKNLAASEMSAYDHLPFFYSDLFDLGYEAAGRVDSRLQTVEEWQQPNQKGVIYYLDNDIIRGIVLWNVWDKLPAARQQIGLPYPQAHGLG